MPCKKVNVSWVEINERKYVDVSDLVLLLYRAKAANTNIDEVITFFEEMQSK